MELVDFPRLKIRNALLAGVMITSLVGCPEETETVPEEGLQFELFTETYRAAQCQRAVTCGLMPDVDTCYVAFAQDLNIAQSVAAVAFGDMTYDPKAAQTCIDTVTAANCEGILLLTPEIQTVCDAVFGNRLGEGADCVASAQCDGPNSICQGACGQGCCHGTCKGVAAAGADGDLCNDLAPCGEGLRCLEDPDIGYACQALAGPNETCTQYGCIAGYSCDPGTLKCFQQASSGASCNPALGDSCASLNEYCNADGTCVALPRPGEACGVNPVSMGYCARSSTCVDVTCVQLPSVGDECLGESACLGSLNCSGDPDFICQPLGNPDICVNFSGAAPVE